MSDKSDGPAPWSIRGVDPAVRQYAIKAAQDARMTVGEWLTRWIREHAKSGRKPDLSPAVIPPSHVVTQASGGDGQPSHMLVLQPTDTTSAGLSDIERIVSVVAQMSDATRKPAPRSVAAPVYRMLRARLAGMESPKPDAEPPTQP